MRTAITHPSSRQVQNFSGRILIFITPQNFTWKSARNGKNLPMITTLSQSGKKKMESSAFMNANTCEYYFKTYGGSSVETVSLWNYYENSRGPVCLGALARHPVFPRR